MQTSRGQGINYVDAHTHIMELHAGYEEPATIDSESRKWLQESSASYYSEIYISLE